MTWQESKHIAAQHAARINLPRDLRGVMVKITEYDDEATLRFLKAEESEITLARQRMINQAFARECRKRGAVIQFVPVNIADFYQWLGHWNLANTAANRAQYISWLTAPKPKPTPWGD